MDNVKLISFVIYFSMNFSYLQFLINRMKLVKYSKTIYQNLTIMKQSIILLWYGV